MLLHSLDLESRSDIPNSILRVKVWYDDTLLSHPKINRNQNKAKRFLDKAMEEAQKLLCLDSLGFRLTMKVSFNCATFPRSEYNEFLLSNRK